MKLILVLSVFITADSAYILPQSNSGFQYNQQQGFNSHERDSKSDESYYLNAGGNQYEPFNQWSNNWSPASASADINQYYNSKNIASEADQSYYNNLAVNNGGNTWSTAPPYWSPRGNAFDSNQYYNSRKAESESDQSYYNNYAVNNGFGYRPPAASYIPNREIIWSPSGSALDLSQYYNSRKSESESDQSYFNNIAQNGPNIAFSNGNFRPSFGPWPIGNQQPTGGAFDISQYYNSQKAASESDQSYYNNIGLNNGNSWPTSYLPSRNGVIPSTSLNGDSFDVSQYSNSKNSASGLGQTYNGYISNENMGGPGMSTQSWIRPQTDSYAPSTWSWSQPGASYPGKFVSESFRDSESQSSSDQSSYLNKLLATNQGISSESARSQSSSNNAASDTSYDYNERVNPGMVPMFYGRQSA